MEYLKICSYQPTQLQGGDTSPFEPNSQLSKGSFCWHFWQNCQVSDTSQQNSEAWTHFPGFSRREGSWGQPCLLRQDFSLSCWHRALREGMCPRKVVLDKSNQSVLGESKQHQSWDLLTQGLGHPTAFLVLGIRVSRDPPSSHTNKRSEFFQPRCSCIKTWSGKIKIISNPTLEWDGAPGSQQPQGMLQAGEEGLENWESSWECWRQHWARARCATNPPSDTSCEVTFPSLKLWIYSPSHVLTQKI